MFFRMFSRNGKKTLTVMFAAAFFVFANVLPCTAQKKASDSRSATIQNATNDKTYRDQLISDLMLRAQVADKMIETGIAGSFIDLSKFKNSAELKAALVSWIARNPDKAAVYAGMILGDRNAKREFGSASGSEITVDKDGNIRYTKYKYFLSDGFMSKIKDLAAAANDPNASMERMVLAGRNMYDGTSYRTRGGSGKLMGNAPPVSAADSGNSYSGSSAAASTAKSLPAVYKGAYDDYKLNRKALDRETSHAEQLISFFRGDGNGPKGAEQYYAYAWKAYGRFESFVSPLKSRKVITESESEKLEQLRADLRRSLAGLSLRLMAVYAEEMSKGLKKDYPGHAAIMKSLRKLLESLDSRLAAAGQTDDLAQISDILSMANAEFSSFYMAYSLYSNAAQLREQSLNLPFSCLYDKLVYSLLENTSPQSPYVKARQGLGRAADEFDPVMDQAAVGNSDAVISGGKMDVLGDYIETVRRFSEANRKYQYFSWGFIFRPFELLPVVSSKGITGFRVSFPWLEYKMMKHLEKAVEENASKAGSPDSGKSI